jgi:hypothetical protein
LTLRFREGKQRLRLKQQRQKASEETVQAAEERGRRMAEHFKEKDNV